MGATVARPPYTEEQITDALMAVIAHAGSIHTARKWLRANGKRVPTWRALDDWVRTTHWERYQELRDKYAAQIESAMVNDYRDAARVATDTQRLAIDKARERLVTGEDQDPARTAANLGRVSAMATEKMQSLDGRMPQHGGDDRSVEELFRSLISRKILVLSPEIEDDVTDAQPELEAGADG